MPPGAPSAITQPIRWSTSVGRSRTARSCSTARSAALTAAAVVGGEPIEDGVRLRRLGLGAGPHGERVEPVEAPRRDARRLRHPAGRLADQRDQHRLIPPMAEPVGHGLVGRPPGQGTASSRSAWPRDGRRYGRWVHGHELRQDRLDPVEALGLAAVDLAEVMAPAPPCSMCPGPCQSALKLMNADDDLVRADAGGNAGRVHAVPERDHDGVGPDQRGEDVEAPASVSCRFHGEERQPERDTQLVTAGQARRAR